MSTIPTERWSRLRRSRRFILAAALSAAVLTVAALLETGLSGFASANSSLGRTARPTIVLVHGDWADGSSWNGVIERLQRQGFSVLAPPNPLRGPTSDAAYLASFLQMIPGPIVLVSHSYGGFVATDAATGNPNVRALVYIDAFIPDVGQTLAQLAAGSCVDPTTAFNAVPNTDGVVDLYLRSEANPPYTGFSSCFANGLSPDQAAVLTATQRPAAVAEFGEPSGPPAWKTIPAWSLIGTADHVIPPAQQQAMSTHAGAHISMVNAGHLSLIIRPDVVTSVIKTAVAATSPHAASPGS